VKRVLRYLQHTSQLKLCLGRQTTSNLARLDIFADSDFARDRDEMMSTSGMTVVDRYGSTIAWRSAKQNITARSTADAEYIATAMAMEYCWLYDPTHDKAKEDRKTPRNPK
jgi:hypothetical protein